MVKISGFLQRKTVEGKTFIVLELEGGLQVQTSQSTGNHYASIAKCTIPCAFSEETARELIGTTLPGEIIKTPCDPYSFLNPKTKEEVTLDYRYSYSATDSISPVDNKSMKERAKEVIVL